MAHPMFPLLEMFYDSKHRAHIIADEGEVFFCKISVHEVNMADTDTDRIVCSRFRRCSTSVHVLTRLSGGMSGTRRTFAGLGCCLWLELYVLVCQ